MMTQTQAQVGSEESVEMSGDPGLSETTRIFVSGLPPKFTSQQLASHFGTNFQVTDAHVIADRRIGFVGFRDATSAQNAAKHFNRTYIRMSKIAVDLARPVTIDRNDKGTALPVSKKRYNNSQRESERKRKRSQNDDGEAERGQQEQEKIKNIDTDTSPRDGQPDGINTALEPSSHAATDVDWLRGRTTRTLDLIDPDDVDLKQGEDMVVGNKDEVHLQEATASNIERDEPPSLTVAHIEVPNGRLFLRNLAFSCTTDDLRACFESFGKLHEVSLLTKPTPLKMMLSDRDSLCSCI